MIQHASNQYNIPVDVLRNLFMHESGMRSDLVGPAGELGIGQFMPGTAKAFGIDPRDPAQAIPATALFLRQNLNRFGNNMDQALAGYAWGPSNVANQGMANAPPGVKSFVSYVLSGKGMAPSSGGGVGGAAAPGGAPSLAPPTTSTTPLASAVAPTAPAAPAVNPNALAMLGAGQLGGANSLSNIFGNVAGTYQQQAAKNAGLA
jgi:hypothetical protein